MQTLSVGLSLVAILIAAGLGWLGTAAARSVALRTGIVNAPNPIVPDHVRPVPYLGGIGIALGVFGALLLTPSLAPLLVPGVSIPPPATGLLVGAVLFLGVGLADDLLAFGASRKIVLQFASAGVALALGGLTPAIVGLPPVDALIAALWIVSVVNAVNFIDVSDGLAGTLAATSATLFALTIGGDPLTALAVTGACIGFLVWNRPPARIFMGDAGSLFLGFLLAGFGLTARVDTTWWPFLPLLALLLVVPLFDLVFQTTTRMIEGRPWFIGGPDSYALRLQRAGLSKAMVASVTALVTVAAWAAGWLLLRLETGGQVVLLVVATVLALIARQWLLRFHVERRADGPARLAGVQEGPTADRPSLPVPEPSLPVPEVVDVR